MEKPFVLVVDDNQAVRTLIIALLNRDYAIETAGNGAEAVEKLKRRHYAVILLDLLMPQTDGYAVLDFLRDERPDLLARTIVVTASLIPREMERVRQYAVFDVVAKPFEIEVLQAAVRRCTGGGETPTSGAPLLSAGMIFLLADLLRQRLM